MNNTITVETVVKSTLDTVWDLWTKPEHIVHWNAASDDWECPHAENNVVIGGKFSYRMAAKDGSSSFDFTGTYTDVVIPTKLSYHIDDGRTVAVSFTATPQGVHIIETFEMESINSEDLQRTGWQAILNNFKAYVEKVSVTA